MIGLCEIDSVVGHQLVASLIGSLNTCIRILGGTADGIVSHKVDSRVIAIIDTCFALIEYERDACNGILALESYLAPVTILTARGHTTSHHLLTIHHRDGQVDKVVVGVLSGTAITVHHCRASRQQQNSTSKKYISQ